jgi:hypothetical protein
LLVGTANDAIDNLAVGANDTMLMAASRQATRLKWATPAVVLSALGIPIANAKGDLIIATALGSVGLHTVGANGSLLLVAGNFFPRRLKRGQRHRARPGA